MIKKVAKIILPGIMRYQRARMIAVGLLVLATMVLGVLWIRNPEGHYEPIFSTLGVLAAIISALPKAIEFLANNSDTIFSKTDKKLPEDKGRQFITKYDVFLSHHDKDTQSAELIAIALKKQGINPFLDKWHIVAGQPWQKSIELAFRNSESCAVIIGPFGLGPVHRAESDIAVNRQLREENFPVVPVLLPNAEISRAPEFLLRNTWVDFRSGLDDDMALARLISGIRGELPSSITPGAIINPPFPLPQVVETSGNLKTAISVDSVKDAFLKSSSTLLSWPTTLADGKWLERDQLGNLTNLIASKVTSTTILLGDPGSGKSALLAHLANDLVESGNVVLAVKADLLPAKLDSVEKLQEVLHLPADPINCIKAIADQTKIVLLVDQLDALADLIDLRSDRLNVMLNMIHELSGLPNIHIIVSSRTFEHQHDPRLRNLDAETIILELPSMEAIETVLKDKGINSSGWPQDFRQILRTPQYLNIYLQISEGSSEPEIFNSYHAMLNKLWDEKILKHSPEHAALIEKIAIAMSDKEELWLPAVKYQDEHHIVDELEAEGILAKDGSASRIGFRHQTLFEYARARAFVKNEGSLSNYVLDRQDALFVRPQLWNALHYLRNADKSSYRREMETLWKSDHLRVHLRMLLIEFLGQLPKPEDYESVWLLPYISRPEFRRRILTCMVGSPGWFERIAGPYMPLFMAEPAEKAVDVIYMLQTALSFSKDQVVNLIEGYWLIDPKKDYLTLRVLEGLNVWDERALEIACKILKRADTDPSYTCNFANTVSAVAPLQAPRLIAAYLERALSRVEQASQTAVPTLPENASEDQKISHYLEHDQRKPFLKIIERSTGYYELPAIAEAAPKAFLDAVWPLFVRIIKSVVLEPHHIRVGYLDDHSLSSDLSGDKDLASEQYFMTAIENAITILAETDTESFLQFYNQWKNEDVLVIQRLLGRGLEKIATTQHQVIFDFLLENPRRLILGNYEDLHSDTKRLIGITIPKLNNRQRMKLEHAILTLNMYKESHKEEDPKNRLDRIKWNREHRLRLLRAFPQEFMSESTRRLMREEERAFPHLNDWDSRFSGFHEIGSPMSSEQMAKAKNEDIVALFDELGDDTGWDHPKHVQKGGTIQASRALEDLAKEQPTRVVQLVLKMKPGKNEVAVGHALQGLAKSIYPTGDLFTLIHKLHINNFNSPDFHNDAARALDERLKKNDVLTDEISSLMESWLSPIDEHQKTNHDGNLDNKRDEGVTSVLWRHGGMRILPHGNYPILEVLSRSCLLSKPPQISRWLDILERHMHRREDPDVWRALTRFLQYLGQANHTRAANFIDSLFTAYPAVRDSDEGAIFIANILSWPEDSLIQKWLTGIRDSSWSQGPQAYAEILLLRHARFPASEWVKESVSSILLGNSDESQRMKKMRIGLAFATKELWSEIQFRPMATDKFLTLIPDQDDDVLTALADIFRVTKQFTQDEETWKIFDSICKYPLILAKDNASFIFDHLEEFLTIDPDRVYNVSKAYIEQIGKDLGNVQTSFSLKSENLINIALTLQRLGGKHRQNGLELFERLLEIDAWGVKQTLVEIDRRPMSSVPPRPRRRSKRQKKK